MPEKWERCVEKVKAKGGKYNPYAICSKLRRRTSPRRTSPSTSPRRTSIYIGPRGGKYYISEGGKKIYMGQKLKLGKSSF